MESKHTFFGFFFFLEKYRDLPHVMALNYGDKTHFGGTGSLCRCEVLAVLRLVVFVHGNMTFNE